MSVPKVIQIIPVVVCTTESKSLCDVFTCTPSAVVMFIIYSGENKI